MEVPHQPLGERLVLTPGAPEGAMDGHDGAQCQMNDRRPLLELEEAVRWAVTGVRGPPYSEPPGRAPPCSVETAHLGPQTPTRQGALNEGSSSSTAAYAASPGGMAVDMPCPLGAPQPTLCPPVVPYTWSGPTVQDLGPMRAMVTPFSLAPPTISPSFEEIARSSRPTVDRIPKGAVA